MKPTFEDPGSPRESIEWIVDVDVRTFEREILSRSLTVPVLVDFWASWCGPCKTLGPELERRAREGRGRFLLAKVDIDRNPELAQAFRVQAVPTVLAIVQGRMVDRFQGSLTPAELDLFLDRVAPASPNSARSDARVERAQLLAEEGQTEQAVELLREILREKPEQPEARFTLVELLIAMKKLREARLVLENAREGEADSDRARALRARIDFAESAGDLDELRERVRTAPEDLGARTELAKVYIAAEDHGPGLEQLLEVVRRGDGERRADAKRIMLEVFAMLGLEHSLANEFRFKLSLELFS